MVSAARSTIMTKLSLISNILSSSKRNMFQHNWYHLYNLIKRQYWNVTKHPIEFTWLILPSIFVNSISNMKHLFSFQVQEIGAVDIENSKYINVQLNTKLRAAIKSTKADILVKWIFWFKFILSNIMILEYFIRC